MMVVKDGPLKIAVEREDTNIIKQELITYKTVGDTIVKEIVDRRFLTNGDYIDSTSSEPLMKKRYTT
tara:strand:+ start:189 stop:389 length:201 start_codon:yes stop_codon:yes gene_type:complete